MIIVVVLIAMNNLFSRLTFSQTLLEVVSLRVVVGLLHLQMHFVDIVLPVLLPELYLPDFLCCNCLVSGDLNIISVNSC